MGSVGSPWGDEPETPQQITPTAPRTSSVPPMRPVPQAPLQQQLGAQTQQAVTPRRAVLLLPLNGPHAELGNQLMMAVQLAVQDLAPDSFVVAPFDTSAGAAQALQRALQQPADVIIGPLFSVDVAATKGIAAQAQVPMLALSNDQSQADGNTYLMGSWPGEQVERVVDYASQKGVTRFVAVLPENAFGNAVRNALPNIINPPAMLVQSFTYNPQQPDVGSIATVMLQNTNAYDAVLLPDGDPRAGVIANGLRQAGALENSKGEVRLLGSALWEDTANADMLTGGWYAAQDPAPRQQFSSRYMRTFGIAPPAVANLAYDAAALAAVLASRNWPYTKDALVQSQGFAGMGGTFRLENNGLVRRALTVQEISASGRRIVDAAPARF